MGHRFGPSGNEYEVINEPGSKRKGQYANPIDAGGAGTVYCVRYRDRFTRAVKIHNPKHGSPDSTSSAYLSTFSKEIEFLSTLNHQNLIKLIDFDFYSLPDGTRRPYFVMDYIDGREFLDVCKDPTIDGATILALFADVIDAVSYLHAQRVLHADVKSQNVRCRRTHDGLEAILLDLGAAHRLPEDTSGTLKGVHSDSGDKTLFVSTRDIAHADHRAKVGELIHRSELVTLFPYYDLRPIGLMLQTVLAEAPSNDRLRQHLGIDGLTALETIRDQLLRPPTSPHYESADQLKADWRKLDAGYLAPMGVPEMSIAAQFRYSILSPSGRTTVTERLHNLINHKLFERLEDIPQLEFVSKKYPGATHTRKAHAASVYRNARYYLAHLLNHPSFRLMVSAHDVEACLLLALLHDIGHYQLSHMFEDYAAEHRAMRRRDGTSQDFIPDDDDLFPAVFDGGSGLFDDAAPYVDVVRLASERSAQTLDGPTTSSLAEEVSSRFSDETLTAMRAIRAVLHDTAANHRAAHLVMAGVLSSPIDADKVSYLIDDATLSGVPYGQGVDLDGLLGALMPPLVEDIKDRPTIGLSEKGIAAAESVAIARQFMFRRVYWLHTNRATMAATKYALSRLLSDNHLDFSLYLESNFFSSIQSATRWVFDRFQEVRLDSEMNPVGGLLEGERRYPRRLMSITPGPDDQRRAIHERLRFAGYEEILRLEHELADHLGGEVGRSIPLGGVLLDIPMKDRGLPGGSRSARVIVYSSDPRAGSRDLNESTPLLTVLKAEHDNYANKARVFLAPEVYDLLSQAELNKLEDAALRFLASE